MLEMEGVSHSLLCLDVITLQRRVLILRELKGSTMSSVADSRARSKFHVF